jgi:ABC-type antimicrobial peptide transport system permease subunit
MIAQYVLKSFFRHKARTIIVILALLVVTAMLVTLNNSVESLERQIVDLIEQFEGEHDVTITRAETSPIQYIDVERVAPLLQAADPAVVAVYPRFLGTVELQGATLAGADPGQDQVIVVGGQAGGAETVEVRTEVGTANGSGQPGNATLLARTPEDELGQVKILEGEYKLDDEHVVIMRVTADTFGLKVGDDVDLSYILPLFRLPGQEMPENISAGRVTRRFTVSGIGLAGGLGGAEQNGVLASLDTVQDWLGVPGQAERLVVVLDETVYGSLSTQNSVFRVRRIAEQMVDALGSEADTYDISIRKAQTLDFSDVAFAIMRSLSAVYGIMVMGVVGLLVYSIVNTNVEERQRDLAFLRILGARRRHLFALVLIEVALIGLIGVGLGTLAGHAFSVLVVAPLVSFFISNAAEGAAELGVQFQMTITAAAMIQAASIAAVVLGASALAPARKAANTKVRHAINPGAADNIQIEDLARLRSRKFDVRILVAGFVLTVMWLLVFVGSNFLFVQGNESVIGVFLFGGMLLLVVGVSLLFYTLTLPFGRILVFLSQAVFPKLTFFAGPNLMRAKRRNTMIALMIVFSATLPTFLGTEVALEQRNYDVQARFDNGAPIVAQIARWRWYVFGGQDEENLTPGILDDFRSVPGIAEAVGLTAEYQAQVTNRVELRNAPVQVRGLTASLDGIVYGDLTEYASGGPQAFDRILAEPDTIILGAGYAEYMDVAVGDVILVQGEGTDHVAEMRVVGLIERMAGFGFSRNENDVRYGSAEGLVSLDTYLRLTHDPTLEDVCPEGACSVAERDEPVITAVMATTETRVDEAQVVADLRKLLADQANVRVESTAEDIRTTEQSMRTGRVVMLAMAVLSFVTSIFGVFAVVYVAVYVRRLEIGMLKAIGMRRRELVGTFALESVMMTVSASLAGVTAGTALGYIFYISNNLMRNTPTQLTFDWMTTLAILVMVTLASVVSASLAARGVVRSKVTSILREAL